jgi:ribosome-binding factor A
LTRGNRSGTGARRREAPGGHVEEHRRADRVAHEIHRVLSDLLVRRSSDPRLAAIALTRIRLTPDLRLARVYFTLLDDAADRAAAERALRHAAPFLRRGIAESVSLRYVPDLAFAYDSALAGARRVETLLHELRVAEGERGEADEGVAQAGTEALAGATDPRAPKTAPPGDPTRPKGGG